MKICGHLVPYPQRLNGAGSRVAMLDPVADAFRRRIGQTLERESLRFENGLRRRRNDRPLIGRFEENPDECESVETDVGRYHRIPETVVPKLVFGAPDYGEFFPRIEVFRPYGCRQILLRDPHDKHFFLQERRDPEMLRSPFLENEADIEFPLLDEIVDLSGFGNANLITRESRILTTAINLPRLPF